jgi:uncharacterized protein YegL
VDICFLVDESGSINFPGGVPTPNWEDHVIPFLTGVVDGLEAGNFDARAGIVTFANFPDLDLPLEADLGVVKNAIDNLPYDNGETYLAPGLKMCKDDVFENTVNPDRRNIVVLLSDGFPTDLILTDITDEAADLQGTPWFAEIVPVAVGTFDIAYLDAISTITGPPKTLQANEFGDLVNLVEAVIDELDCDHVTTTTTEAPCPDCDGSYIKEHQTGPNWVATWPPKIFGWNW